MARTPSSKLRKPPPPPGMVPTPTMKKIGAPRKIKDGATLLRLFNEYIEWNEANPTEAPDTKVNDGVVIQYTKKLKRPMSLAGFSRHIGVLPQRFRKSQRNGLDKEYWNAVNAIVNYIESDRLEGGLNGLYNGNIVSRTLGLAEKTQAEIKNDNAADVKVKFKMHPRPMVTHPDATTPEQMALKFTVEQLEAGVRLPDEG